MIVPEHVEDYALPFQEGWRVLEVGGGEHPLFRPNLDVRPGPTVDLVADLNRGLPLPDAGFQGVFSAYLLEHLSWRRVRPFMAEIHRVLAPGGIAALVIPNTLEQCRKLVETAVWTDELVCMLFGDQNFAGEDWVHNAHHTGFSPEYAVRLFREAGFHTVRVIEHPVTATDMIVEAHKSAVKVAFELG